MKTHPVTDQAQKKCLYSPKKKDCEVKWREEEERRISMGYETPTPKYNRCTFARELRPYMGTDGVRGVYPRVPLEFQIYTSPLRPPTVPMYGYGTE